MKLPLEWLSSRPMPELHRLEQLCRETAREQRCTQRRLQEVEDAMEPEKSRVDAALSKPEPQTQLEQLSRKLSAANAELRRYETRMFAYERTMLDLRKENSDLKIRCEELSKELDKAYADLQELKKTQALTATEMPELPVIEFPPEKNEQTGKAGQKPAPKPEKAALRPPRTKLEHLSDEVLARLAQLMPQNK